MVNGRDVVIVTDNVAVAMEVEDERPVLVADIEAARDVNVWFDGDKEVKCTLRGTCDVTARIKDVVQKM